MFPHGLTCAGCVAAYRTSDVIKTVTIAWTRVHAIIKSTTCAKGRVSDEDRTTYLAPRGNPRTSRSASNRRAWAASDGRDCSQSRSVDRHRTVQRRRGRTSRSSRDRTPSTAESILLEPTMIDRAPASRLTHDRGPITARSWPDRGAIVAKIGGFLTVKSGQNRRGIEAVSSPIGTAPTTLANRLHDRSNDPRSSDQFSSLKEGIPLSCSLTFDRFVKELSEFRGRSLVHRDPPAFRLNFEGIGAWLITNSSLISSNFPLEFRKIREKGSEQIHSNSRKFELKSHGNQVSSEIRSIIKR